MTSEEFREWLKRCGFKQREAAELLYKSERAIRYYVRGIRDDGSPVEIPPRIAVQCLHIEMDLTPIES